MDKIKIELKREEWYRIIDILESYEGAEKTKELIEAIQEHIPIDIADEDMPF